MSALLMPNDILSMTAQAARRVVELGDGDCALLYLALLEGNYRVFPGHEDFSSLEYERQYNPYIREAIRR